MALLTKEKNVRAQGIELDDSQIYQCVEKGLSVFHSDIDSGLPYYPDQSFDYVILNQSLQEVKKIDTVIAGRPDGHGGKPNGFAGNQS